MIKNPERYIESFAQAGADIITVHVEATNHLHRTIDMIKKVRPRSRRFIKSGNAFDTN